MKKITLLLATLAMLSACDEFTPATSGKAASAKPSASSKTSSIDSGTVNIDGERITVYRQEGTKWAAYGGENGDPQRYITYRKERAIELKSGCHIDKRLTDAKAKILIATVKC